LDDTSGAVLPPHPPFPSTIIMLQFPLRPSPPWPPTPCFSPALSKLSELLLCLPISLSPKSEFGSVLPPHPPFPSTIIMLQFPLRPSPPWPPTPCFSPTLSKLSELLLCLPISPNPKSDSESVSSPGTPAPSFSFTLSELLLCLPHLS
jgi:hypothetical protein